jgi:cyclohexyl-isocyanide hydratase
MIRLLTADDDDAYRVLWARAISQHGEHFRTAPEDDAPAGIPTAYSDDSWTLGAFDAGRLVGIVSVQRERGAKLQHKALLSRMFIHPDSAGSGLGTTLLRETLVQASTVPQLRQIWLTVLETNEPAQRLYAAAGFRSYSHEPEAVKIGERYVAEIQMVRFLRRERRG